MVTVGGFAHVRPVVIGGGSPVVIQTMWKEPLTLDSAEETERVLGRIEGLAAIGCRLLRFAVPQIEDADVLGRLALGTAMPLVADIHFDYRIALRCLDYPIAKLRINPGNIGGEDRVRAVLEKAAEKGRPIRIGVNAGSLPRDLREQADRGEIALPRTLVAAAERELAVFDRYAFPNVIVSMKASSVPDTVTAARLFREKHGGASPIPLHVGVTEAGPLIAGVVRNTAALTGLLKDGIGDTIRVSLSSTMENEVIAAREILALFADSTSIRLVSCPRCGRASFDTHGFTERWQMRLYAAGKKATIAVMGCVVNGPGEARAADLGITGAGNKVLLFRHGEKIRTVDVEDADRAFEEELSKLE
ncbi:MAG: (E)-4-hydroxy-3-methylbut-2-enyl-diphosphate synthase [Spirochaetaceae bacterium]|nr:(E)-4-hydroxy-3-methylbut-2-enyl-diphosphate synthase [Spirochaetaceae bacterium]